MSTVDQPPLPQAENPLPPPKKPESLDELRQTTPFERSIPRPTGVNARSRIVWSYLLGVLIFHALIPLAFVPYFFSWWGVLWLPIGNYLFCSLGIGAGFHRLLTHRGYKCPLWFEHLLAVLGICCLQETPARWVLTHRLHHQHSDHQPDPHSPMVSFFWSHMSWLFVENRDTTAADAYDKYARDLLRDPFYLRLERNMLNYWIVVAHIIAFIAVGAGLGFYWYGTGEGAYRIGAQWFLWGVVYRTIYTWHVTWAVNSVSHLWGYRNYATRENSRNNWIVALATSGEGWHNNHHAQPRSAAHGHKWWELDITYITLCCLERVGLVWDVVRPVAGKNEEAE